MELNFLNEKLNIDINKHHDVTENSFWYYYCLMLNIRTNNLSEKDCKILSLILSQPSSDNVGEINFLKHISTETNTALPNLYNKYKEFLNKGFLIKEEERYVLHPFLYNFQKYIKNKNKEQDIKIKFTLPFNIKK